MKSNNKIIIICLLSGILLASCNNNTKENIQITETDSDRSETLTENTTTLKNLANADYNGYTFNIFGEKQSTLSDYFFVEEQTGEVIDDSVYKRNSTVEEKYNVLLTFTLIDWNKGADTIKTYTLAGDDTYDLYTCTQLYIGALIAENYFVDWNQVGSVNLNNPWYVQNANETLSIGDKTPLLFGDFMESNILRCWHFVFNKRLADENKLGDLYEVVSEDKWTMDYLTKAVKDLSRDLDGDTEWTEEDFYGLCTDKLGTLDAFSRSLRLNPITKDENNLPVLSYYNERVPDAFEKSFRFILQRKFHVYIEQLACTYKRRFREEPRGLFHF